MIRRIQSHNIVNGVAFVVCEFALIVLVVTPFGVIWAFKREPLYALVAAGIVANALCMVALGVQAWRAGERGSSLRLLFNRAHRTRLLREHPRMSEDTFAISLGTLIPFGLTVLVLLDIVAERLRSSR